MYTVSIHEIKCSSWVSVQRRYVRIKFLVLVDLQIVDHLSHTLWVILRLDVGEMARQLGDGDLSQWDILPPFILFSL
jgi:hypothetical protein